MEKPNFTKHLPCRFALIGLPGSGKSTFAVKLGKLLSIPVHHLDRHMFEPNGKKRDKQDFLSIQKAIVNEESWVIEGCSSGKRKPGPSGPGSSSPNLEGDRNSFQIIPRSLGRGSFSTFEMRFARADTVIYFFLPRYLCFLRMLKRLFNYQKLYGG